MTQTNDNTPAPLMNVPENEFDDEINLLDLLQVVLKRKKIIGQIVVGAIVLSVIVSLLLPKMYTATARVLPPSEPGSSISSLLSQAGGAFAGLAGGLISGKTTAELYRGILESRTVADALIEKFELKERYDKKYLVDVYKELAEKTDISVSRKDEIISVSVEDRDPQRAADMANSYVEMLDKMNRTVNINEGQRKRIFLEKRLETVQEDLGKAETALKEFQEKYKVVAIEEQAKAAIEGAGKIKGEIIMAQTELEVLKQFGTEKQNEAIMLKSKIDELQNQLERIEKGTPRKASSDPLQMTGSDTDFYIPFDELPALGMQLARLMREAKIQEKVFELMTTEYELAKIEEAKDVNTIQILDKAVAPDKKSSPKRSLIVILSTFMAFFVAVFTAFIMEYIDRLKTEDPERYQQIKEGLKFKKSG
jgi:uncharacterized protein involved in exopolysaccharide biosynthesis